MVKRFLIKHFYYICMSKVYSMDKPLECVFMVPATMSITTFICQSIRPCMHLISHLQCTLFTNMLVSTLSNTHTHAHTHTWTCTHTHTHACTHIMRTHTHTHTCMHTHHAHTHACTHMHTHTCTHTWMRTHGCTRTHTHMHAHTHMHGTHMHAHTHACTHQICRDLPRA